MEREQAIEGCSRFLQRVYRLVSRHAERLAMVPAAKEIGVSLDLATPKEKILLRKAHQVLAACDARLQDPLAF